MKLTQRLDRLEERGLTSESEYLTALYTEITSGSPSLAETIRARADGRRPGNASAPDAMKYLGPINPDVSKALERIHAAISQ